MNEQALGITSFNPEFYLVLIASQSQSYNCIKAFALVPYGDQIYLMV